MNNDIRPPQQRGSVPRYERPPAPRPGALDAQQRYAVPQQAMPPVVPTIPGNNTPATPANPIVDSEVQNSFEKLPAVPPKADTPRDKDDISGDGKQSVPPAGTKRPRKIGAYIAAIVGIILVSAVAGVLWYLSQLQPVSSDDTVPSVQLKVESNTTADQIANQLKNEGLIRSELAFNIYTRISNTRGNLKAGSYIISPTESTKEIVGHLMMGRVDEINVTFYPGAALSSSAASDKTPSHKEVLINLGYDEAEIQAAFTAQYDHPLLASRPPGADLEGYILGDTYRIAAGSSVEDIMERTFDIYYERLEKEGVLAAVEQGERSLHEVIILASIVQREVAVASDQPQVAQVFLSRLEEGMNLGSDVTYQYIADKTGVPRDVNLDSPYNTRRYTGLPPGPIASPGISAIQAVVSPAEGDYLFFLSGDDDVTYFARTVEEHERNIKAHCEEKCSIL